MKRVYTAKLKSGFLVKENVFVTDSNLPIVKEGTILTDHVIELFIAHGVTQVLVDDPAASSELDEDEPLPEVEPFLSEKLRDEALNGIRRMFTIVSAGAAEENMTTAFQAVREIGEVVDELVDTLSDEANAFVHIAGIKSYDDYTYHHSLSVAVLSIAIGKGLGLSEPEQRLLGRSAMLHDIGKTLVPVELINKPGRLTDEEFAIIREHPALGYDYLLKMKMADERILPGVLYHHEKLDGRGYPRGVSGNDLPVFSRIVAIADVYDAITSYRSYRKPMPPRDAMELIMSETGFDYDIVKTFIEKIEPYPVNTCVVLSNMKQGIVIDTSSSQRPIIRLRGSGEIVDLLDIRNLNLVITGVVERE